MKNATYWRNRFTAIEQMNNDRAKRAVQATVPSFDRAEAEIQRQIDAWYNRFANNNEISLQEAKILLNSKELKELKWDIKDYIKYGKQNSIDQQWIKELENASAKFHISRLEALKIRTQQAAEKAFGNETDILDELLTQAYSEDYYHTAYEIQKGIGIGWDVGQIDQKKLDQLLKKPWTADRNTFSDRIWRSKRQLVDTIDKELTRMCILGGKPDDAINAVSSALKVSKGQAGRLIMTESAYFASAAQKDCFNDLDVDMYEIVATLDSRTSDICQQMDGKTFPMKDFQAGVTAPPFHPWCRSCTVPYFDDEWGREGTRAARDRDGKTYQVPSDMKYSEWEKTFVNGGDKGGLTPIADIDDLKKRIQEKEAEIQSVQDQINDLSKKEQQVYDDRNDYFRGQSWYSKYLNMSDEEYDAYKKSVIQKEKDLTKQMEDLKKEQEKLFDSNGNWLPLKNGTPTEREKGAVEYYVSGEGMYINQDLRNRISLDDESKEYVKDLDGAISKFYVETDELYRSVDASAIFGNITDAEYYSIRGKLLYDNYDVPQNKIADMEKKLNGGFGLKTELGYMSTTESLEVAEEFGDFTGSDKPVVLRFVNAKGRNGFPVKDFFEVEGDEQYEVLLGRGQQYRVTQIYGKDGNIFVDCEFLGTTGYEKKYDDIANEIRALRRQRSDIRDELNDFLAVDDYRRRYSGKTEEYFMNAINKIADDRNILKKELGDLQKELGDLQNELANAQKELAKSAFSSYSLQDIRNEIVQKYDAILKTSAQKDDFQEIVSRMDKGQANLYNRLMQETASDNNYYMKKTGFYRPSERRVYMDLNDNSWEKRLGRSEHGAWSTKFHEESHQLDHILASRKSPFALIDGTTDRYYTKAFTNTSTVTGKRLITAIDNDIVDMINRAIDWEQQNYGTMQKHVTSLSRIPSEAKNTLIMYLKENYSDEKSKAYLCAVTDAIGMTTKGNLHPYKYGFWGHRADYCRDKGKNGAVSEMWAEMNGAFLRNDEEYIEFVRKEMPSAVDEFKSVYEEVIEYAKTNDLAYGSSY